MKKRKIVLIVLISLLVVGLSIGGYFGYRMFKEKQETNRLINEIKNSYSEHVVVLEDKDLFNLVDGEYVSTGTIYKDAIVSLVYKEVLDKEDIYYQIKDSNYYIDYKDIKKTDEVLVDDLDGYVVTKSVNTNPTKLYSGDKLVLEVNEELSFDVLLKDNDNYYVEFLNNIYYVKDNLKVIEKKDVDVLKDISVLSFDNISNDKLAEVLKHLQDNKYSSINITDFKRWVTGQVDLEKNKVLLISSKELDSDKLKIINDYGFTVNTDLGGLTFISGDTKLKVGASKYYKYDVTSNTTLSRVKDMLNGVKVKTTTSSGPGVAVLNYHFFYDSSIGEACNESICLDVKNFRKQLQYLKDNNYKVLTMKEFNDWMDGKLTFSQKAVLITIDDGAMGTSFINGNKLIPLLEEFKIPATLFLITGWWDVNNYKSDYLEVHSHGDELHYNNFCRNGKCTYKGLLLSKDELKADLQLSVNKIGNNLAFCYPFYAKNSTMVEALKETGFKLGFIGGNRKARRSDNKYAVPRYIIYKNTSLNSFINMVK